MILNQNLNKKEMNNMISQTKINNLMLKKDKYFLDLTLLLKDHGIIYSLNKKKVNYAYK